MNHKYFESNKVTHLIEKYFYLSFSENDLPFKSAVLPLGLTHLFYIGTGNQKVTVNGNETLLKGLMITGQYFRSYNFSTNSITTSIGANLHPTALHKLLNIDVSKLKNTHAPLLQINKIFHDKLLSVFEDSKDSEELIYNLNFFLLNTPLHINKNTKQIDRAISLIREKDGLLSVLDIVDEILISQKSLEIYFKKIVGLTPGRYIRQFRFLNLMEKRLSKEIELKDLINKYNYFDSSHFAKDFKLFMNQDLKSFFKQDYTLIEKLIRM
jgi:AraC-like DNA-binding protein